MTDTSPSPLAGYQPGDPTDPTLLEVLNGPIKGALAQRLGIEYLEAAPERVVARMPVEGNTQPYGLLHGGASVALAESVGSVGAALLAGQERVAVGLEINATHHKAAHSGMVTATATMLSSSRSLASYEVVVVNEAGDRVCTCRILCMLRGSVPKKA